MAIKKFSLTSWLFLVPAGIIYLSVVIIPVVFTSVISFFRWNGVSRMEFIGVYNYINLFQDPIFIRALSNNLIWLTLSLTVTLVLPLGLAVMLNKKFTGRTFFRGFFYFPVVIANITAAIIWRWIYNPLFGFVNQLFEFLNITWIRIENLVIPYTTRN